MERLAALLALAMGCYASHGVVEDDGLVPVDHGEWQLSGFIAAEPCDAIDRSGP